MAWITRLEGGTKRGTRYKVHWRDPAGHHRSITLLTRKAADERKRRIEIDLATGVWRDPKESRVLLRDYIGTWLAGKVDLRQSTRDLYEATIRLHVLPRWGETPIGAIRTPDVRAWLSELTAGGTGKRMIQIARQVFAGALQTALEDGALASNPVRYARGPAAPRRELVVPSTAQVEAIAAGIAPPYRAMVLLAAYGGLRFGELAGLQRRDVHLLERRVEVLRQVVETTNGVGVTELKTKASRRSVKIPGTVADELASRLQSIAPGLQSHVFTASGNELVRKSNFRDRVWLPALAAAGVRGVRFHDLRHHAAAVAIAAGAHAKAIQERMGHASIKTTLDVYGHLFPSLDEDLADRLEQARQAARPPGEVLEFPGG